MQSRKLTIFLLFLISIFGLVFFLLSYQNSLYCSNCNVILISIDTLRRDHLGVYGYKKNTSPNLDSLAKESYVFENAFATAAWTLPSHASIFTSRYPSDLRVETVFDKLPDAALTLTEVLKKFGYITAAWDRNTFVSPRWGFEQGFDQFNIVNSGENAHDADIIFPQAAEWVKKHKDKKFFLFLHAFEVHDPYCPPGEYSSKFKGNYDGKLNCVDISTIAKNYRGEEQLSKNDLERFVSLYDGEIAYTDFYIGKFLNEMKKQGLFKNTIIVVVSDHGEEFGERGVWGLHAYSLYNELIKIPLIIKAPQLGSGKDKNIISTIDLAPSILKLLGIQIPAVFKGKAFSDIDSDRRIYAEKSETGSGSDVLKDIDKAYEMMKDLKPVERKQGNLKMQKKALVYKNWILIKDFEKNSYQLFDGENDPLERLNIFNSFKNIELKNKLISDLEDSHK